MKWPAFLSVLPSKNRVFKGRDTMQIAYYPGCSGLGTSKEYESSTQAVCRALGLEFLEIPGWSCCGSTPAHSIDLSLSAALSCRNLLLAARAGAEKVTTPCPSCLSNLKLARHRVLESESFKEKVDALLDAPIPEAADLPDTFSVLQILLEQVGVETIAKRVTRPLEGMKVATYYGCLMSRPKDVMGFDNPENPTAMDKIMVALGAQVVPFPLKTECCGASMGIPRKEVTATLAARILASAKSFGAEAVVVACPLCHMNLDLRQGQAEASAREKFGLPVFYFTQLMGLAFGLGPDKMLWEKLVVNPTEFLQQIMQKRKDRETAVREKAQAEAV